MSMNRLAYDNTYQSKWDGKDTEFILGAREYALKMHGDEKHAETSYEVHLGTVTEKLREKLVAYEIDTEMSEQIMAAGWLHDTVEDTDVTSFAIKSRFGGLVGTMVDFVTDQPGKNRITRHLTTYYKLRHALEVGYPLARWALLVKLSDRFHNHARSIAMSQKFASMYADEYQYFKFALWTPDLFQDFWDELDAQYIELKKFQRKHTAEQVEKWRVENNSNVLYTDTKQASILNFPVVNK